MGLFRHPWLLQSSISWDHWKVHWAQEKYDLLTLWSLNSDLWSLFQLSRIGSLEGYFQHIILWWETTLQGHERALKPITTATHLMGSTYLNMFADQAEANIPIEDWREGTMWNSSVTNQEQKYPSPLAWSHQCEQPCQLTQKDALSHPNKIVATWAPSQYKDRLIYVWRFPC